MSLVAVGACYIDTILTTPRYPEEDEKLRASRISHRRGGNCPNTIQVMQQLIAQRLSTAQTSLELVAVLPRRCSNASQQFRDAFEPAVSCTHCIYRIQYEEPASSYIIKSQATGSRTIVNYNELPEMTFEEFAPIADKVGPKTGWFHFEGRIPETTLACIKYVRQNFPRAKISVEVEKPGRPGLESLAMEADVVFYSKSWAEGKGYKSAEECVRAQSSITPKASLICCTWGEDGAVGFETGPKNLVHSQAYTPPDFQLVDSVGAGDAFIAGMLFGLICKGDFWDLTEKLTVANRVAGMKVAQEGFSGLGRALHPKFFK
ncbi:hypothetical protein ARAM_001216 [Aspergillus rambellii]|uniref:Carbohydrate kinase PfkB domain-containing protein n=3 Tax=Aspergillus subgen. Nidulantes TaxID=2720870 RepID=A0A0F8UGQ0_9EURO|nr:hypothetical protein ARAM_001216 [Aspergillus rambellii]